MRDTTYEEAKLIWCNIYIYVMIILIVQNKMSLLEFGILSVVIALLLFSLLAEALKELFKENI